NNGFSTLCNDAGETSTVGSASPTATTQATDAVAGGTISDVATLSGGTNPTGTISFSIYGPADANCTGTATSGGSAVVSGNAAYPSSAVQENVADAYPFSLRDALPIYNNGFSTLCNDAGETSTV